MIVTYYEPTYGMVTFRIRNDQRAATAAWLDAGGYTYTIKAAA